MDQNNRGFNVIEQDYKSSQAVPVARMFLANVFIWMTIALGVTAITAYWFASSPALIGSLYNFQTHGLSGLGWVVTFAPIGFVLLMSMGFQRLSPALMTLLFIAFAILMGMSLSFILLIYTAASVYKTFIIAAGMFGIMAAMGGTWLYHKNGSYKIRIDPDDGGFRSHYRHGGEHVHA